MSRSRVILEPLITGATLSETIAVASTGTAYTHSFKCGYVVAMALKTKFTSDGSVDVQVDVEQGDAPPTTEGSSDSNWAIPEGQSAIQTITDENVHYESFPHLSVGYARLKLTGQGSNHSTTTLAAKISKVEDT